MRRETAVETDGTWAGFATTEAGAISGWHHHGEYESTIYILTGGLRMEFGPGGSEVLDSLPGDFVFVDKLAVHRESNPTQVRADVVVVRSGHGPALVNVDGPEPG